MSQVKDIDDYLERRRKLGRWKSGPSVQAEDDGEDGAKEKTAGWRAKAKAKAKASAKKNEKA